MAYTILQPTCFDEVWLSPALGFDVARPPRGFTAADTIASAGFGARRGPFRRRRARHAASAQRRGPPGGAGGPEPPRRRAARRADHRAAVRRAPCARDRCAPVPVGQQSDGADLRGADAVLRRRRRGRHGRAVAPVPGAATAIGLRAPAVERAPGRSASRGSTAPAAAATRTATASRWTSGRSISPTADIHDLVAFLEALTGITDEDKRRDTSVSEPGSTPAGFVPASILALRGYARQTSSPTSSPASPSAWSRCRWRWRSRSRPA